jgi:flagellar biosynthesis/type III secretory pathway protein FliH
MAKPGRVLSVSESARAIAVAEAPVSARAAKNPFGRVLPSEVAEAHRQAKVIIDAAQARIESEQEAQRAALTTELRERAESFERECERREAELLLKGLAMEPRLSQAQEARLCELSAIVAERLIGEQLRLHPETLVRLTCEVLRETSGARRISIYAEPEGAALLLNRVTELSELFSAQIDIVPDESLSRADLVVDSELGRTDARLKTRLHYLLQLLTTGQSS